MIGIEKLELGEVRKGVPIGNNKTIVVSGVLGKVFKETKSYKG